MKIHEHIFSPCTNQQATLRQSTQLFNSCENVLMAPILSALACIRQVYGCPERELASNLDHLVYCCPRWLLVLFRCFRRTREARVESILSLLEDLKGGYGPVVLGMACSSLIQEHRCFTSQSRLRVALIGECQKAQGQLQSIFCSMRALAAEACTLSSQSCSPAQQFVYSICLGTGVYRVQEEDKKAGLLQKICASNPALSLSSRSEESSYSLYWDIFDGCNPNCHRLLFKVLCVVCNEQHFSCQL